MINMTMKSILTAVLVAQLLACGGSPSDPASTNETGTGSTNNDNNNDNSDNGNTETDNNNASLSSWGSTQYLSNTSKASFNPDISIDNDGNAIAVWVEDSTPDVLRAAYLPANSNTWLASEGIDSGVGTIPNNYYYNLVRYSRVNPQVSINNNVAFAAWVQNNGTHNVIYANRHDANGWGTAMELTTGNSRNVRVVVDASGIATVIWIQTNLINGISQTDLMSAIYSPQTATWTTTTAFTQAYSNNTATDPQINATMDGHPTILWLNSQSELLYSIFENGSWQTPEVITSGTFDSFKMVTTQDDQQPAIILSKNDIAGVASIYFTRRGTDGSWSELQPLEEYDFPAYAADMVSAPNGKLVTSWSQNDGQGNSVYYQEAYVREYDPVNGWHTAVRLDDLGGTLPKLAADNHGHIFCVWDNTNTWVSEQINGTWSTPTKAFGGTYFVGYNNGSEQKIATNSNGRTIAIWTEGTTPKKVGVAITQTNHQ